MLMPPYGVFRQLVIKHSGQGSAPKHFGDASELKICDQILPIVFPVITHLCGGHGNWLLTEFWMCLDVAEFAAGLQCRFRSANYSNRFICTENLAGVKRARRRYSPSVSCIGVKSICKICSGKILPRLNPSAPPGHYGCGSLITSVTFLSLV